MATVIDTLVVELGLDASKFTKAQKTAVANAKTDISKQAKETEAASESLGASLSKLKGQALGVLGLFLGGRGLKEFGTYLANANSQLGYTATSLNTTVPMLAAWQEAAKRAGGTAQGMTQSISGLVQEFQTFALTGESSMIPWFRAIGAFPVDETTGKMKDLNTWIGEIIDKLSRLQDPAKAAAFGRAFGFDQGTINLILKGPQAVAALLEDIRRIGVTTGKQAEEGQALASAWARMAQAAESVGRSVLEWMTPSILAATEATTNLLKALNYSQSKEGRAEAATAGSKLNEDLKKKFGRPEDYPFFKWLQEFVLSDRPFQSPSPERLEEIKRMRNAPAPAAPLVAGGGGGSTRADRNNNPGNIKYGDFAKGKGATGADSGGFAVFPTREAGFAAAEALLGGAGYRNLTLSQIGARWAEGDPGWARNVSRATGLPTDRPLTDAERALVARQGIPRAEGSGLPLGASAAAASGSSIDNRSTSRGGDVNLTIGTVQVPDAATFVRDLKPVVERSGMASQAQTGPQ